MLSDEYKDWLRENFPDHEYLKEVGAEPIENTHWEKKKHEYPLGSLNKVNSFDELKSWGVNFPVVVQHKLDGISICLTYEKGLLKHAVTRGKNGVGDDITRNVIKMKGVPSIIDFNEKLVVRGEIILKHSDFNSLSVDQRGKNPRNTAAGAAKKLSGDLCHHLTVVVYDLMNAINFSIITESVAVKFLNKIGFPFVVGTNKCSSLEELESTIKKLESNRMICDYDIDGLVIKNNEINPKDEWEHPKNKIAYKFEHQASSTTLLDIVWNTSGERVNPIAILEPVDIAGVTVSKASLHNAEYIEALANGKLLLSGCRVEVTRRNDVIPQVEQIVEYSTNGKQLEMIPSKCPVCSGHVEKPINNNGEEMAWYVCTNISCQAKAVKNVLKWFEVHDCKGVADKTVELIYENISFNSIHDFFCLIEDDEFEKEILALSGMGKSKLNTIREQIKKTRRTTISNFLGGLNISGFGPKSFKKIVDHLLTSKDKVTIYDVTMFIKNGWVTDVEGFSESSAKSLKDQFEKVKYIASKLLNSDFVCEEEKAVELTSNGLSGSSFCFTGALDTLGRKEAQELVEKAGGVVKSSVTKGLTYLVTNDTSSGSSKNKKATDLGVAIINESEFLKLVNVNV